MYPAADPHSLQVGSLPHELEVLLRCAEAHDALHAGAVVPRSIEEHDLTAARELFHVALEVPLRALALTRLGQRDDARAARVEVLGETLDRPPLPAASRPSNSRTTFCSVAFTQGIGSNPVQFVGRDAMGDPVPNLGRSLVCDGTSHGEIGALVHGAPGRTCTSLATGWKPTARKSRNERTLRGETAAKTGSPTGTKPNASTISDRPEPAQGTAASTDSSRRPASPSARATSPRSSAHTRTSSRSWRACPLAGG